MQSFCANSPSLAPQFCVDFLCGIIYNTNVVPRVVIDTSVLVSGLRSRNGASYRLLTLIDSGKFEPCVSVPLVLEHEAAGKRATSDTSVSIADVDAVIDYVCHVATHHKIHYLWRPALRDPKDDMVLELAVNAGKDTIVTHNLRHFRGSDRFGVRIASPGEFLREIGGII